MKITKCNPIISPNIVKIPNFNPTLKLGILASGNGTNFETIISDINNHKLDAEIKCLIVNNSTCGAIKKAQKYSVPYYIHNHKDFTSREDLDRKIISTLRDNEVEGIVMVGWMRIITNILIKEYSGRIVNLHPSLLPSFKGYNAIKQALIHKVKFTGCTVHLVEEEVDSGEILIQSAVPIYDSDNEELLRSKIQNQEHQIISKGIAIAGIKWRDIYC